MVDGVVFALVSAAETRNNSQIRIPKREFASTKFSNVNFSGRFSRLIKESDLTQKELAAAIGVAESAIVNYKRGRVPKAEELLKIAQHFGVTVDWLLTGKGPRTTIEVAMGAFRWKRQQRGEDPNVDFDDLSREEQQRIRKDASMLGYQGYFAESAGILPISKLLSRSDPTTWAEALARMGEAGVSRGVLIEKLHAAIEGGDLQEWQEVLSHAAGVEAVSVQRFVAETLTLASLAQRASQALDDAELSGEIGAIARHIENDGPVVSDHVTEVLGAIQSYLRNAQATDLTDSPAD
jgi:transcriptional regulator with XRE-family HTH domain